MKFTDVCLITENVLVLTNFYEAILQTKAEGNDIHAEIETIGTGLAIYSKKAAETDMGFDFSKHWGTGNFTLGFNVHDVDVEYERLIITGIEFLTPPTTYPWGARSMHFRDPDGNIICFRSRPIVGDHHSIFN
ncbi:VOC family protein [Paenibacillus sp. 19GGS1-52]|uniref:VOC family protein n=1 Tax=Paenibacillus sp. 19GGS1-52 TaxID=2758563 RepID=UPI001EFAD470|nr:VOC family protein [Paenibacillus sp. 19GGS1-52]ULO05175.1 VOC family protein [Paenibacillus sp. 19GGS1-52]